MTLDTRPVLTDTQDMFIPHGMFRTAFAEAPALIGEAAPGDGDRATLVSGYFIDIIDFLRAHHGAEDALLWPLLRERRPDQGELLDRMEGQHAGVHEVIDKAAASVRAWAAQPDASHRDAAAAAVRSLLAELDAHLVEEEREILPLAATTVTPEEWGKLPGHAMGSFAGRRWLVLGLILGQMSDEQRAGMMLHMPETMREMWQGGGADSFSELRRELAA